MYNNYDDFSDSFERLSRILKNDKIHMPKMIESSLKKDILKAVSTYVNLKDKDAHLRIEVANNGEIFLSFEGIATGIKAK